MNLDNKDLNLLIVFAMIWEERSISKAAARLYLSQSAISHSLKKLREQFNDPLFVRSPKGVTPTDFSFQIAPRILSSLSEIDNLYNFDNKMELKTIKRNLILAVGDYFSMTIQEKFILEMEKRAPYVKVICKPVSNLLNPSVFEQGEAHLGITAINLETKRSFHSKTIYKDKYSFCVNKNHPIIKNKINLNSYLNGLHINVSNFGKELGVVDIRLAELKKRREVKVVVSSFFDAARLLKNSNLILSAPTKICESLAQDYNLKTFDLPFSISTRPISLIWHERTNKDIFHQEIRKIICGIAL